MDSDAARIFLAGRLSVPPGTGGPAGQYFLYARILAEPADPVDAL